ncbi:flagellar motor switch protein FliN [Candidatus Gastranaerophilus sp. (ex Termes propinquus)]|nr:flagellar motor switch protein FliN [Candidatus Gastranaerophilus sp. (ex Termes propinquus)]
MSANVQSANILTQSYSWFEDTFSTAIKKSCNEFWESDFQVKLYSVTTNETVKSDIASKGEMYFITQISLNAQQNATFRLSGEFIRIYLHTFLGSISPNFKLTEITELEMKILNSFSDFLLKGLSDKILPYESIPKVLLRNREHYNLTFLVKKGESKSSKIVLTLPQNVLVPKALEKIKNFKMQDFEKVSTFVNIRVGTTKLTLNDLKALRPQDIILLEESNIHKMLIKADNIEKEFKVNPNPSLILDLDDEIDTNHALDFEGVQVSDKNIWDDIQIDVSAEFKKVKMTLGELKQISKGIVVDLGPAFDSKISLVVEDKLVARGELVIINDNYGVRVDEIFANPHTQEAPEPKASAPVQTPQRAAAPAQAPQRSAAPPARAAAPAQAPPKAAPRPQEPQREDFDYSDFENDE